MRAEETPKPVIAAQVSAAEKTVRERSPTRLAPPSAVVCARDAFEQAPGDPNGLSNEFCQVFDTATCVVKKGCYDKTLSAEHKEYPFYEKSVAALRAEVEEELPACARKTTLPGLDLGCYAVVLEVP